MRPLRLYLPASIRTAIAALAIVAIATLRPGSAMAQIDAQLTQYYMVPTYYNAGAVGNSDWLKVRGGSRLQWVNIPRSPQAFILTADMPLKLAGKRIGVGAMMQQESIGLFNNLTLGLQGAYKFKAFKGEFSAGFQIGLINQTFRGSDVVLPDDDDYHQSTDEGIPTTDITGYALDLGLGVYYTHRLFWAGLSATHLNSPTVTMAADGDQAREYEFKAGRTLYFMAGSNIPLTNTLFEIQPSLLVKSDLTFTTWELTTRVCYNKFLTGGLSWRQGDAVSFLLGAAWRNFYLGYSYDYSISALAKASGGSHEFWIGYQTKLDLGEKNRNKHKSIRIM